MKNIQLKNISKSFGSNGNTVVALDHVNFSAGPGQVSLIIGPSGSGKSTLLTILGGLQTPDSGDVLVNGKNINRLDSKSREKVRLNDIGFVLQAYNLVPFLRVKDQFELVNHVTSAHNLSTSTFDNIINELGIQNNLNQYPRELSGGQTQRVAIARALYTDPSFILADEPTAALDSNRVEKVGSLFKSIAKVQEKTVVIVTHDTRLEKFADHIFNLVDGKLTEVQ